MSEHQATPEQWKNVEDRAVIACVSTDSCLLELRARVEALEAQADHFPDVTKMVPPPVATDEERLIGRVSFAIMSVEEEDDDDDPSFKYTSAAIELGMGLSSLQARAAILEVARWMREQGFWSSDVDRIEQEAGR